MSETEQFANPDLIWRPEQLKEKLRDENLVILDLRPTHEVMGGIIPGAAHLDIYGLGLSHTRGENFDEFIQLMRSQLGLRGVSPDKTVVLVEEETGNRAGRAFWLLEYMGHQDVHVLDGGMQAWRAAGMETTQQMNAPKAARFPINPQPQLFISSDDLHKRLGDPNLVILDTRSDKEWSGENKRGGPRGGTIPGAVHLEWRNFIAENGCLKSPAELTSMLSTVGITRDKPTVPF